MKTVTDFTFSGSEITVDGDCTMKRRRLLLGRKAMIHLDSILKSRDITLPTMVCIVKAMVFPVVTYGCESWTIKKAEHRRTNAFELWCWRRLFESSLDCKEIQSVHPKGNQSWIFIGRTDVEKLQYFSHLMQRTESLEKTLMLGKIGGRRRRGQQRMRWLDGTTDSMDVEFEQAPRAGDGQGSLACCSPWGRKVLDTTERLNWTDAQIHMHLCVNSPNSNHYIWLLTPSRLVVPPVAHTCHHTCHHTCQPSTCLSVHRLCLLSVKFPATSKDQQ